MRNVTEQQLKKAIFMESEDFVELVKELKGWDLEVDECGIYSGDDLEETPGMDWETELNTIMSNYFDTNVTSIHTDNCVEQPGVWIVYKD